MRYYNFDVQTTMPAPVYVLYRQGEDKPVADQLDIIDTVPGDTGYNDFRQVWKVTVPKDYVANTMTDSATLLDAGYKMEQAGTLRNMPVVPDKSKAGMRLNGESAELRRAWYRGQVAKFFSFAEAPLSPEPPSPCRRSMSPSTSIPARRTGSRFRLQSRVQLASRPTTCRSRCRATRAILRYGWWRSTTTPIFQQCTIKASALKAKVLAPGAATVNCPIVFVTP